MVCEYIVTGTHGYCEFSLIVTHDLVKPICELHIEQNLYIFSVKVQSLLTDITLSEIIDLTCGVIDSNYITSPQSTLSQKGAI